jgi:tRNA wybutosine-synthesizing protein 3
MFNKKDMLDRTDRSLKGKVDSEIKFLVNYINSLENYYTTSSCAGRIVLLSRKSDKKYEAKWLYITHKKATFKELKKALGKIPNNPVWFKQESSILHICCKTIEDAKLLLEICHSIGWKRPGIISMGKRIIVEILSTEYIDTLVADKGKVYVNDEYLKVLIKEADNRLMRNRERFKKFYEKLKVSV